MHALICPIWSRYRRWRYHQPFWCDDKTAAMCGIAHRGCWRCGAGIRFGTLTTAQPHETQPNSPGAVLREYLDHLDAARPANPGCRVGGEGK